MRKVTGICVVAVVLGAAFVFWRMVPHDTYKPTAPAQDETALQAEIRSLYYFDGPMQTLMSGEGRRYFAIEWNDDGTHIWLSVKECTLRSGTPEMTPHSPRLPNFAALQKEVENLPARSLLFYGTDDVPPITDAITGKEKLLLDRILRSKEGRLYCFPGG